MAEIVDALVVTLGLDSSKFDQGAAKAKGQLKSTGDDATRTAKEMEARGEQAAQFFGKIKVQALGLLAVLLGGKGIEAFTSAAVTGLSAMGKSARNVGLSVPDLAAFRNAVQENGGSADEATTSFQNLTNSMEAFKVGQGDVRFAGNIGTIGGHLGETPMEIAKKFAQFAEKYKDDPAYVNRIGAGIGFDQGTINELSKGPKQFADDMAAAVKRGVPDSGMTERMTALQKAFIDVRQQADFLGNSLLSKLAPGMTAVLKAISGFIEAHPNVATGIGVGVAAAGAGVAGLGAWGMLKLMFQRRAIPTAEEIAKAIAEQAAKNAAAAAAAGGETAAGGAAAAAGEAAGGGFLEWLGPVGAFLYTMRPSSTNEGEAEAVRKMHEQDARNGNAGRAAPAPTTPSPQRAPTTFAHDPVGWLMQHLNPITPARAASNTGHLGTNTANSGALFSGLEQQYALPAGLLDSDWAAESSRGNDLRTSSAGAMGQFQFMPDTARQYGVTNPDDLPNSATGAAKYFHDLMGQFGGSVRKAIAAYNWGPGNLSKDIAQNGENWESFIPAETTKYLAKVMAGIAPGALASRNNAGGNVQHIALNGPITIHTRATDAKGVASALRDHLNNPRAYAMQSNMGLA